MTSEVGAGEEGEKCESKRMTGPNGGGGLWIERCYVTQGLFTGAVHFMVYLKACELSHLQCQLLSQ